MSIIEEDGEASVASINLISEITEIESNVLQSPMDSESLTLLRQLNQLKQKILDSDADQSSVSTKSLKSNNTKGSNWSRLRSDGAIIQGMVPPSHPPGNATAAMTSLKRRVSADDDMFNFEVPMTISIDEKSKADYSTIAEQSKADYSKQSSARSLLSSVSQDEILITASTTKSLNSSFDSGMSLSVDARSTRHARREKARSKRMAATMPNGYKPDLPEYETSREGSLASTIWNFITYLLTFPISDSCIKKDGHGPKKAWREKIAIFILFLVVSVAFIVGVCLLPQLICVESDQFYGIDQIEEKGWTIVFGKVYSLQKYSQRHPGGSKSLEMYMGKDASSLFPRLPPTELPPTCLNMMMSDESVFNETNSLMLQNITCSGVSPEDELRYGMPCHTTVVGRDQLTDKLGEYEEGDFVIPGYDLQSTGLPDGAQFIQIEDRIYNVTQYVDRLR